jgi:hypothetical protein
MSNLLVHPGNCNPGQRRKLGRTNTQMPRAFSQDSGSAALIVVT